MNDCQIKEINEINGRYSGTEWKYMGEDENLKGRIWRFDYSYPDNRRGCYMLRFSLPMSNKSNSDIVVKTHILVPFETFKRHFSPYRRQNIVAEEKSNPSNATCKTADSKPRNHKKPCVMTNQEIADEIELEKNGWTEKEIRNEIDRNRKKCSCDKCHDTKLTGDEILATLLFNFYNLRSLFR